MDQDVTWCGPRPRPRRLCVTWGPLSPPQKGAEPLQKDFSAHVYCGQTAGWMTLVLGMEVGLSPSDFVLDGDPAPPQKGRSPSRSPIFGPCLLWPNGWMDQDATWHEGRPRPRRLRVRWGSSPLPTKGVEPPPQSSAHFYCGQTAG